MRVRRASDIAEGPEYYHVSASMLQWVVGEEILNGLPPEWRVLPDGRATHSVIRAAIMGRLRDLGGL